jgi:hypothetical protein
MCGQTVEDLVIVEMLSSILVCSFIIFCFSWIENHLVVFIVVFLPTDLP